MPNPCNQCVPQDKKKIVESSSFLSALFVIIIPKCPICVMAYTSAITICGGENMYLSQNNWISYIPIFLSVMILGMILWNRRGVRTWMALITALVGSGMIILAHQLIIEPNFYNYGSILLFLASLGF